MTWLERTPMREVVRRLWPAIPLLALLAIGGCDEPDEQLRSLDVAELSERFACDDVTVIAANIDGNEALFIGVEDGLAAAASDSGEEIVARYELPDERLTVRWVSGSNVYEGHCGRDNGNEWRLDERRDAISGALELRLTPDADGKLTLSATLDEVLLAPTHASDAPLYELVPGHLDTVHVDD